MQTATTVERTRLPLGTSASSGNPVTSLSPKSPVEIFWEDAPSSRQALQPPGAEKPKTRLDSSSVPLNRPGHTGYRFDGTTTTTASNNDNDEEKANMKDLWLNLVLDRLTPTTTAPKLHFVERNLAGHSPGEMEALCRRWQRAELGWKTLSTAGAAPHAERPMDLDLPRDGARFLLPGGRWLFSVGHSIAYYNLDLPAPEAQHLVDLLPPTDMDDDGPLSLRASVPELDTKSATLVFNIAVVLPLSSENSHSSPATSPSPAEPRSVVQIWRIRLRTSPSSGGGRFSMIGGAGEFVSQQLAAFPYTRSTAGIRCVSLSGANVAISGREEREGERYTDVIDWVDATGESLFFPRRVLRTCYDHIYLLPTSSVPSDRDTSSPQSQSHLFAYNRHTLALFAHTLLAPSSSPTAPRLPAKHALAWQARIDKGEKPSACSPPYVCKGSIRFVVYSSGTVYGAIISTSTSASKSGSERGSPTPKPKSNGNTIAPPVPARLVTLAHLPSLGVAVSPLAVPTLGYRHAVFSGAAVTQEQSLVVVSYEWPEGDLPAPEGPFATRPAQAQARIVRVGDLGAKGGRLPDADGVLVDEGTGRVVLLPEFGADAGRGRAGPVVVMDLGGEDVGRRTSVYY